MSLREWSGRADGRIAALWAAILIAGLGAPRVGGAQTPGCDQGEITGQNPHQNAEIVICSPEAQQIRGLTAQIKRLSTLIQHGGQPAQDVSRFLNGVNATAREAPARRGQITASLAKLIERYQGADDRRLSKELGVIAIQLEELDDTLSRQNQDPAAARNLHVALRGPVGEAIGRLDAATANRLLDEATGVNRGLTNVEHKIETTNSRLAKLQVAIACSPDKAADAIGMADSQRTLELFACNGALLRSQEVQASLSQLFATEIEFESSVGFRAALRAGGVNFVRDFEPSDPDSVTDLMSTPLFQAAQANNRSAVTWLLNSAEHADLKAYSLLLPHLFALDALRVRSSYDSVLDMFKELVLAGIPVEAHRFAAYRTAVRENAQYAAGLFGTLEQGRDGSVELQHIEFLHAMAGLVAPDPGLRRALYDEEVKPFRQQILSSLDQDIRLNRRHLAGQELGSAIVNDHFVPITHMQPVEAARAREAVARCERLERQVDQVLGTP